MEEQCHTLPHHLQWENRKSILGSYLLRCGLRGSENTIGDWRSPGRRVLRLAEDIAGRTQPGTGSQTQVEMLGLVDVAWSAHAFASFSLGCANAPVLPVADSGAWTGAQPADLEERAPPRIDPRQVLPRLPLAANRPGAVANTIRRLLMRHSVRINNIRRRAEEEEEEVYT